jgi:transcriptional regulator GlxA family with amidase domain
MEACYAEPLGVAELARVACLSPAHFLRSFKALFGVTPHGYLTEVRLRHARRLLETTELPVTAVCFEVGFESLGSFSSLVRRRFGVSPSALRRNSRIREAPEGERR